MDGGLEHIVNNEVTQGRETVKIIGRDKTAHTQRRHHAAQTLKLLCPHARVEEPVGLCIGDHSHQPGGGG